MTTSTAIAPAAQPAQSHALASITGSSRDPAHITAMLQRAAQVAHVVTPVSSCPELAEGIGIVTSAVLVQDADVYEIPGGGGKVGLAKSALDRIAMALGLRWEQSTRLDDGRTRHYACFQVVGSYLLPDGSRATCMATKEVDLRDGSPAAATMSAKQLAGARLHTLSLAESKAKNRAVRSLGVRPAYTRDEVRKPFVCLRATFTGTSSDPELRRAFGLMIAQNALSARAALYGDAPAAPRLPPGRPAPPVGQVDHDDDGVLDGVLEEPEPTASATTSSPPASANVMARGRDTAPAAFAGEDPAAAGVAPSTSDAVVRFGREKGKLLSEASDETLEWLEGAVARSVGDPSKDRWRSDNETYLLDVRSELARRQGDEPRDDKPPPDDDIPF
jgi:hypothetical protein